MQKIQKIRKKLHLNIIKVILTRATLKTQINILNIFTKKHALIKLNLIAKAKTLAFWPRVIFLALSLNISSNS